MIATLFNFSAEDGGRWVDDGGGYCAVVSPHDLSRHWRGDRFAVGLAEAVVAHYDDVWRQ